MHKLLVAAMLLVSSVAHSEPLWGNAESKDSVQTIKKKYPEGKEVLPDENTKIGSGAYLRYRIEGVEVLGNNYEVGFYFQKESLEQVTLRRKSSLSDAECDASYNALLRALSGKYGAAANSKGRQPSRGMAEATFSSEEKSISMTSFGSGGLCSIYIFYKDKNFGSSANL